MTKFAVIPLAQSGESTTISAGRCRERQRGTCVRWLQARPRGNLRITDITYRNLEPLRRKCSLHSRRIVSDLAYSRWVVRSCGYRVETPRFQKHKGILALSRLPERILKLVGKAPGTDALWLWWAAINDSAGCLI